MTGPRMSGRSADPTSMSEGARELRRAMRWSLLVAIGCLAIILAGALGWLSRGLVPPAFLAFMVACVGAVWLGLKSHRQALADRERNGRLSLIIAIASQLGKQDDETLRRIAGKSGPAAEAARMILTERRQRQTRASSATPTSS